MKTARCSHGADQVQAIRLGGRQVLQLAEGFEPSESMLRSPATTLNHQEILHLAGFTNEEVRYLEAVQIDAMTIAELCAGTGWNAAQVGRIRRSITARIKNCTAMPMQLEYSAGDSIQLAAQETVCRWTHATIDPEIVAAELFRSRRKSIVIKEWGSEPRYEREMYRRKVRIMNTKITEISGTLKTEKQRLADVINKASDWAVELAAAEQALNRIESEISDEQEELVLDEKRKPDAGLQKRLIAARERFDQAAAKDKAFDGAIRRQQARIDALDSEIELKRSEIFRAALGDVPRELHALMRELAAKTVEIERIALRHQRSGHELAEALFPMVNPRDPYEGMQFRATSIGLFNMALRFASESQPNSKAA